MMMRDNRKNEIIAELYNSGWLTKTVKNICGDNQKYVDDLVQEVLLILLSQKNENMIITLHGLGQLKYFMIKIIKNQAWGVNSEFYRKYVKYDLNKISIDEHYNQAAIRIAEND